MDELVRRLVATVGVDRVAAEKSIGIVLQFLLKEGPADKVRALLDQLPGSEAAVQAADAGGGGGTFAMGGVMGAGTRLMGLGLGMSTLR